MGRAKTRMPRRERHIRVYDVQLLRWPHDPAGMIELNVYIGRQIVTLRKRLRDAPVRTRARVERAIQQIADLLNTVMTESAEEYTPPRVPRKPRPAGKTDCARKYGPRCGVGDICAVLECINEQREGRENG